jgi:hypothetical protein
MQWFEYVSVFMKNAAENLTLVDFKFYATMSLLVTTSQWVVSGFHPLIILKSSMNQVAKLQIFIYR